MTTEQTQAQPETRPSEVRSDALLDSVREHLREHRTRERARLVEYGDGCSMGKCAMSRLHLLDRIDAYLDSLSNATGERPETRSEDV